MKADNFAAALLFVMVISGCTEETFAGQPCCLMACAKTAREKCNFPQQTRVMSYTRDSIRSSVTEEELSSIERELEIMKREAEEMDYNITDDEMNELLASLNEAWQIELEEIKAAHYISLKNVHESCMNGSLVHPTEATTTVSTAVHAKDCGNVSEENAKIWNSTGGVFDISPESMNNSVEVYCDLTTDGGGWTVFQRRVDGSVDFYRNWTDYVDGFGYSDKEFWLGLENIHQMTKDGEYELRIELGDWDGNFRYAKYEKQFSVADSAEKYRFTVGGFSGDAGDSFSIQGGRFFSTKDRDNDPDDALHCARDGSKGGWWYGDCHFSNLNGIYHEGGSYSSSDRDGIEWYHWKGNNYSLKFTEMKFRKKN